MLDISGPCQRQHRDEADILIIAARGAILVPELIINILSVVDPGSLPAAARVCRLWNPYALEEIWRECTLFDLLQTYSSLVYDSDTNAWHFDDHGNSERFLLHARLVMCLTHDDDGDEVISSNVILLIDANLGIGTEAIFLPKLRSIHWSCQEPSSAMQLVPFICRAIHLKEISIVFPHVDDLTGWFGVVFFQALRAVAANLSASLVVIKLHLPGDDAQVVIHDFLQKLKCRASIQYLALKEQAISFQTGEALRGFAALQSIDFEFWAETPLEPLLANLAGSVPGLQELRLRSAFDEPDHAIPFSVFRPILQCTRLTSLYIFHFYSILLVEADILSMGAAWPSLKTLHFPSAPKGEDPGIPLRWLGTFARELPSLTELSVYFNDFDNIPTAHDSFPRFPRLQKLAVGRSGQHFNMRQGMRWIVEFLAESCPPGVKIISADSDEWKTSPFESGGSDPLLKETRWSEVSALVDMAHSLQASAIRRLGER